MAKEMNSKNMAVFSDVIKSITSNAVSDMEAIEILCSGGKRNHGGGISVYFLPRDKVSIDLFVKIKQGNPVPAITAKVQEKIKNEVEGATKYRVHSVNVQVVGVIPV